MAVTQRTLNIKDWAKTAEGLNLIEQQTMFCIGGDLWQGYRKVAFKVNERQITDDEIESATDVDDTKGKVWFRRKQRLQGRHDRKTKEYSQRRMELRKERSSIVQSIKEQKEMGLAASPDDVRSIDEINERMTRLVDLESSEKLLFAKASVESAQAEEEAKRLEDLNAVAEAKPMPKKKRVMVAAECDACGAKSPDQHPSPEMWLRGHRIHHKGTRGKTKTPIKA